MIFFYCSELIEVYRHPLICHLLCPKVSAKKTHYSVKILGKIEKLILSIESAVLIDP